MSPRVLVTDAEDRSALAACRSLADAGYEVSAVAGERPAPGHWSRACLEPILLPHPRTHTTGFTDGLETLVKTDRYAMVMPGSDASLLAISSARRRIEPFSRLGLPPEDAVDRSFDKWALAQIAKDVGIESPESILCDSHESALAAARELGFPVVLKARHGVSFENGRIRQRAARPVRDERALVEHLPEYGIPCLVQRPERGALLSCFGVAVPGRILGFGVSRYTRTFPPEAGSVSFSQTVPAPARLREQVAELVDRLGWQGMFELELIEATSGALAAIDFNPRPYGSLSLAVAAGSPLPALWSEWVLQGAVTDGATTPGINYRWEDADLRHALWQLRRGRFRAALTALEPHRNVVHAHFRLRDPGPLLARLLLLVRRRLRRRAGR